MACASVYICVLVIFSTGFGFNLAQNFCGSKEPDTDKLCVSLRLPWQSSPIYFCTDKGKINYRNKCKSPGTYCPAIDGNSLQISTPWDCCPITSLPGF
ncbi:unnamed protein product [Allacma fusca]|uniref:Single domain-containing protein n=1 Tax=Allacma fusca TaxID=39272 RepID=A0A8J2J9A6_9HEXA|nr:unnamed protein product [Allacma fusca]